MEARIMLTLTHDEIQANIPYAMICETRFGRAWGTGRRRRAWLKEFTEQERETAGRMFRQAYDWYLVHGVPDEVTMTAKTFALWIRLGEFCASI